MLCVCINSRPVATTVCSCTSHEYCKGFATRSENFNKIVSMTSYLRKIIVTTSFVNGFDKGGHVELYRLVALYGCIMIGQASNSFLRLL